FDFARPCSRPASRLNFTAQCGDRGRYCSLWWSRSSIALALPRSGRSTTRTIGLQRRGGRLNAPFHYDVAPHTPGRDLPALEKLLPEPSETVLPGQTGRKPFLKH